MRPKRSLALATERRLLACFVASFVAVGVALLIAPRAFFAEWFFPRLTGVGALSYALLLLLPGILFPHERHAGEPRSLRERGARLRLQLLLAVTSVMTFSGTLGLYRLHRVGFDYDKATHVVLPMMLAFAITRFAYWRWDVTMRRAMLATIALALVLLPLWELLELLSDRALGTSALGQGGEDIAVDTFLDLALGIAGSVGGTMVARAWHRGPPAP